MPGSTASSREQEQQPEGGTAEAAPRKRWALTTKALAGVIAFTTSAVALLFTFAPWLKPDPGEQINGELKVLSVERHTTFPMYLSRLSKAGQAAFKDALVDDEAEGYVVYLQVEINGRKHKSMRLKQARYVVGSGRRDANDPDPAVFESDTPSDRWITPLYVPMPEPENCDRFYARYELYDGDALLSFARTPSLPSCSE